MLLTCSNLNKTESITLNQKARHCDEYDAAQERGEVATAHDGKLRRSGSERLPTSKDVGFKNRRHVHEARAVRDAEKKQSSPLSIRRQWRSIVRKSSTRTPVPLTSGIFSWASTRRNYAAG